MGQFLREKSYIPTGKDVAPETDMAEETDDDDRFPLAEVEDEMEETSSFEQMGFMELMGKIPDGRSFLTNESKVC